MTLQRGIYYPIIVPFDGNQNVDHETLAELLEFGIDRGLHGVFALGSVGQGPVLSLEQRKQALETMVDVIDGEVPLIAHVGTPDAERSIELAEHAETLGVDMVGALPPYYYTSHTGSSMAHDFYEVKRHFERIASSIDTRFLAYNNLKFTGIELSPSQVGELTDTIPNFVGLKSGSTSRRIEDYVESTPDEFMVFTNINYLLPSTYHGIHGSINPPTSAFPELCVNYWEAIQEADLEASVEHRRILQDVQRVVSSFGSTYGRGIYAELFRLRGIDVERFPKWETKPIPDTERDALRDAFEDCGLGEYLEE
jgi:4-hydroxy-tetrahydrodipicolinate synthase/2-dehydro-3-deoxy-phosphogluconate/2-dehydro-3-deoxy-6-phosphogalactonate aldolase